MIPGITIGYKVTFQEQINNFSSKQNSSKPSIIALQKQLQWYKRKGTVYLRSRAVVAIRYVVGETLMASILPEWKVYRHSGSRVCSAKQNNRNSATFWSCAYMVLPAIPTANLKNLDRWCLCEQNLACMRYLYAICIFYKCKCS